MHLFAFFVKCGGENLLLVVSVYGPGHGVLSPNVSQFSWMPLRSDKIPNEAHLEICVLLAVVLSRFRVGLEQAYLLRGTVDLLPIYPVNNRFEGKQR